MGAASESFSADCMVAPYPRLLCGAEGNKGDERGLCEQGSVFADFMMLLRLSEGCGRPRRPCPRLLHNEPFRLAVVTAFSLKLAAALAALW